MAAMTVFTDSPASVRRMLRWAIWRLAGRVPAPRVEAELMLRHVLGMSRADLFVRSDRELDLGAVDRLEGLVERRRALEPLQYLTGTQGFRGLELQVGPGVLVPRPETELVTERALELIAATSSPVVADLGTGSGAIALSIATERRDCIVWATDISRRALDWARLNVRGLGCENVLTREGDLFDALPPELSGGIDLVVTNPPYLSESDLASAPADVRDHEPPEALLSGPTGLEIPGRIVAESICWLRPGGWLVMETTPLRAGTVESMVRDRGYEWVELRPDLAGQVRIVEARRPAASSPVR